MQWSDSALAFFPGLSTVQFSITYSMHKQSFESIYHVKGVMSTSVGRVRRKEGGGRVGGAPN